MSEKIPLVSIIMPVHNASAFLAKALESVLAQTYTNFELIAVDDGSTDDSLRILKTYASKDQRINIIEHRTKQGVAASLNRGITQARGKYLARMDADDEMVDARLSEQVVFLEKHPECVAVGTFMQEIDEHGKVIGQRRLPIKHNEIYQMMMYAMGMQHPTIMFNRTLIPANFEWYRTVAYAEDLDMLFRLSGIGSFANIPKYLYRYRIHSANESLVKIRRTYRAAARVRLGAWKTRVYSPSLRGLLLFALSSSVLFLPQTVSKQLYAWLRR